MRTLDRYLIRELLPPFLIALGVFTFIVDILPMLNVASDFLAKGVGLATVGKLILLLLPQALGLTIPTAFLTGLLMALGRLSADRESLAILACGVSPLRLLRPVFMAGCGTAVMTLYVMVWLLPSCNQAFNNMAWQLLSEQTEQDIKPGLFYEGFPGKVLYIQSESVSNGWSGVFIADTSGADRPTVALAEQGQLFLNKAKRQVVLTLRDATQYAPGADARVYDTSRTSSAEPLTLTLSANDVIQDSPHGYPEMSIAELKAAIAAERKIGQSGRTPYFYWQQMFSFPVACLIFAVLGLVIGLHTRREGRLAGMTIGLAVVFLYYAMLKIAEAFTKGNLLPPVWTRWVPNLVLAPIALIALRAKLRGPARSGDGILAGLVSRTRQVARRFTPASPARHVGTAGRLLGFRLLDRYVCLTYLRIATLAFFGLLALYYVGGGLDISDRVFKHQATGAMVLRYLWYRTPQFVTFVIPMATLVAVLGTIGGLTRSNELTVMRACGVSLYRVALPLVAAGLVWSGVLFGVQEQLLAQSTQKADSIHDEIRHGSPVQTGVLNNRHWLSSREGRIYYYAAFERRTTLPTLTNLSVFETAMQPYRLRSHTYVRTAVFRNGAWHGLDGWVQRFGESGAGEREDFSDRVLQVPEPDVFDAGAVDTESMPYRELESHVERLEASGFSVTALRVRLHGKIAFPLVAVIMTVLGIPFGVTTGRRGALYGVGLAMVLAVAYWLIAYLFVAAGTAGRLPPALAAWATDVLFLALAGVLVLTVRT